MLWPPWDFNQNKSSHILVHLWGRGRDMLPTLTWTWICQQITTVHLNMYKGRTNWGCLVEFDLVLLTRVEYTWIGLDMLSSVLLPIGLSGAMGIINQENKLFSSFCGFSSNWILHYFPLFVRVSVCLCVKGVTSHISHIYKGINAMLIIRGPIKPCIFWIKITLTFFLTRPDQTRPSSQTWPTWPLTLTWNYQK